MKEFVFTKKQYYETGKFFLDLAKLVLGVYVFASLPGFTWRFLGGLIAASLFYFAGITLIRKEEKLL
jgi:hypothetical protein